MLTTTVGPTSGRAVLAGHDVQTDPVGARRVSSVYIGAVPAVAIVPWFLAGTLYPITALPHWLAYIARALPLTHALALLRYGLTSSGGTALYNIWSMTNVTAMAALSRSYAVTRRWPPSRPCGSSPAGACSDRGRTVNSLCLCTSA
jgi:ABC-2 type transporter